ncbi:diaminopropionate ammonia-lyase [Aquibacillus saliphilus]|uniref:diaminopropionate ammonia-lyase n=1 Tax=Aquibacillus saliphilus TaxID=1909422 RepID=UPI001CEFD686|nr:diaminopropionate ammonia-lyase [Aquibacillus saliphilus]
MNQIYWKKNAHKRAGSMSDLSFLSTEESNKVLQFHKSYLKYKETPLTTLSALSNYLGVKQISVKDESQRYNLNAFKVLGGLYAIAKYIGNQLGIPDEQLTFDKLKSPSVKESLGTLTFVSATDGNHGRGVAWAAQQLGHQAVIHMPKGSSSRRLQHIHDCGAEGYITDWNYDKTVEYVANSAKENGWVVIQDTAWEGYEEIPKWIMQGYSAIATEVINQSESKKPTHLFLQAGVGSFASAIIGSVISNYKETSPKIVIVEPDQANCFYRSFLAGKGEAVAVTGDMDTIMAGLACGVPNKVSWEIIRNYADIAVSCSDDVAATGMRILGNPLDKDERIISGESGAVPMGLLYKLLSDPNLVKVKEELDLDSDSHILLINTEGDTDAVKYKQIVWEGAHPSYQSR